MLAFGAEFDLTPREKGMKGAIARAQEIVDETPGAWMPQQFDNPANIDVHVRTTAQEILADFRDQPFDALITGVGTGGHITGCARVLSSLPAQGVRVNPLFTCHFRGQPSPTRTRASRGSFRSTSRRLLAGVISGAQDARKWPAVARE